MSQQPGKWLEIPFDGAPSRAGPTGGRWMQVIVEAPGPNASMQFYVRGPRPDINDEWGSTAARNARVNGDGKSPSKQSGSTGSVDSTGEPCAEDRPSGTGGNGSYTLPWPSGWKLERGTVSKFLRALQGPIMLVRGRGFGVGGWGASYWGASCWA